MHHLHTVSHARTYMYNVVLNNGICTWQQDYSIIIIFSHNFVILSLIFKLWLREEASQAMWYMTTQEETLASKVPPVNTMSTSTSGLLPPWGESLSLLADVRNVHDLCALCSVTVDTLALDLMWKICLWNVEHVCRLCYCLYSTCAY